MKNTMYDIIGNALVMYDEIEEMEGELTPEMEQALIISKGELESKSIAYLEVISNRKSIVLRIKAEKKRLDAKQKAAERIIERLEFGLFEAQKTFGDFEIGLTTITTRKSESIIVENINALPKEFKTVTVTETADKKALQKAIKAGKKIKGVELVVNHNLRIK